MLNEEAYYYFGGAFYVTSGDSYKVVEAPSGAIIANLPEGAEEFEVDGVNYVGYNNTYYQPILQDGNNYYQVVIMDPIDPLE